MTKFTVHYCFQTVMTRPLVVQRVFFIVVHYCSFENDLGKVLAQVCRPEFRSPEPHKAGLVAHVCNLSATVLWRQENPWEFTGHWLGICSGNQ